MKHPNRMKVLLVSSTYPSSARDSTPGFVHGLARRLVAAGLNVSVLAPHLPGLAPESSLDGVRVRRFRYAPEWLESLAGPGGILPRLREAPARILLVPFFLAGLTWALWRCLVRDQPDIVHAHWLLPQGLVLALMPHGRRRAQQVCTVHGADIFALRGRGFSWLRRWAAARIDHILGVSQHVRDSLHREGIPEENITVLSMGVDLETTFTLPSADAARTGVLFLGRLVEKKGVRFLLEAVALLRDTCPGLSVRIAGDGPEMVPLRALAERLGLPDSIFLGSVPPEEGARLMRASLICVVPSVTDSVGDEEGLGLVTIEAMGCGCAVVASDLPAIREVVTHQETGLLVPARDPTALAVAIARLLHDPGLCHSLGENARNTVLERFDWKVITARHVALYEELRCGTDSILSP